MLDEIVNTIIKKIMVHANKGNTAHVAHIKEIDPNMIIEIPSFDDTSEHILTEYEKNNQNTAYYKNGILYNVTPRNKEISLDEDRGVAYDARFVVIDGNKYDLYSPDEVAAIQLPTFAVQDAPFLNVTRSLDYIMNIRAKRTYSPPLAVPIIFKTINLMRISPIKWQDKDYIRLILQLKGVGKSKYAKFLSDKLNIVVPREGSIFKGENNPWDYVSMVEHLKRASEYDWICRHLPNMAPKSLGGYTRMKHSNSKNYLKIKEAAMKLNKELIEEVNE